MRYGRLSISLLAPILGASASAQCPRYEVVASFDASVCGGGWFSVWGMNDHGHIVGEIGCGLGLGQAFVWLGEGDPIILEMPEGTYRSSAMSISNTGDIVGSYDVTDDGYSSIAFLIRDGEFTSLGLLSGGDSMSVATGVNEDGTVIGWSDTESATAQMFMWHDGIMTDIGTPTGESLTRAQGINALGQIAGLRFEQGTFLGFIWEDGSLTEFGPIPGGESSWPHAINDSGWAVGRGDFLNRNGEVGRHAFVWTGEAIEDLGVLDGYTKSIAYGISDSGDIVGQSYASVVGLQKVATLWKDGRAFDLNELLVNSSNPRLVIASGISQSGGIVAKGEPSIVCLLESLPPVLGDIRCNASVDFDDLLALISNWGRCDSCLGDLDDDGEIGPSDLQLLLGNWGS